MPDRDEHSPLTLVCLYGPPASGKLTVAAALSRLTGAKVLHNHLTSDVAETILPRGTPAFRSLVERMRLTIVEAAGAAGVDLISTLAYYKPQDDPFLRALEDVVESVGGVLRYVQLRPDPRVLEVRVAGESRRAHPGKLRDAARLRELLAQCDVYSTITADDLTIDNSELAPGEVAALICAHYRLGGFTRRSRSPAGAGELVAIQIEDPRTPDVLALLESHLAFTSAMSPQEHVHALDLPGLLQPDVAFFTARVAGELVGVGALKEIDAIHGEIKSMHTRVTERRMGVGRAMVERLLDVAIERGYVRVSLETGAHAPFAPARELYTKLGFERCAPFADYTDNPFSMCMTVDLSVRRRGD